MQHANNSENNRQSRGKKDETRSVDTKMYDTRSILIEGAKGIKT